MKPSTIVNTITSSNIKPIFNVKDVNESCNNLLVKSKSFLSKHRLGNPGKETVYFIRDSRGNYSLLKSSR
ncbi:hypothetical protein BC952_2590 [Flavobacterium limicola]|uniref:Uncharacterized protein n=1 Tax=Flavobacterium limicola TaxID=180441 RepID=A0A495S030_9FLAO|nr:hypothetical protein BC952_2590 [Flavobacterium limicola]